MKQKFVGGGLLNKCNSLKLQKFKVRSSKRKVIIATIILSVLVLTGIYLYSSFAVFNEEKHFNVINGEIQDPGDIYFAYYVDGEITRSMPSNGIGYTLDTEKSNCTNGVIPKWDNAGWQFIGDYSNYNATDYTRTRCNLYFKRIDITLTNYIKNLALYDTTNLSYDETSDNNLRYVGGSPNNYVSVDGELWRIIGVMNNIDDGTGNKEARVKLIRAQNIGGYTWDTSESSVNNGDGVNEWSEADLMKLLNPGYESETIGGSLYYNAKTGNCYYGQNNGTTACDFTSNGMKEKLKKMISKAVWHTGAVNEANINTMVARDIYNKEHSSETGKICSGGIHCNDAVTRTTTWQGLVGLINASDYGFAASTNGTLERGVCQNYPLISFSNKNSCYTDNWLSTWAWTMTVASEGSRSYDVIDIKTTTIGHDWVNSPIAIYPVVYLKANVKITKGVGTSDIPFEITI